MTINFETETIITLGEACRASPPNGVSDATMARWIQKGIKARANGISIKLETIVIGGRRLTSREAINRFIAAQNNDESGGPVITATQRQRQAEAAQISLQRELQRAGI